MKKLSECHMPEVLKMRTFKQFLNEMPLPKGMKPEDLEPKKGIIRKTKYNPDKAMSNLDKAGKHLASGSSRAAYRVHVEKEQFDYDTSHLPHTNDGRVDTVIKIARNSLGIAQNKEELEVYNKYKDNKLLLPIIDDSGSHKKKIMVQQGKNSDSVQTISNWLQMPYATQINGDALDVVLVGHFGNLYNAIYPDVEKMPTVMYAMRDKLTPKLKEIKPSKHVNKEQWNNLQELIELIDGGLNIDDLSGAQNWGIYNNKPVILDYGFGTSTVPLYYDSKEADAKVDPKGNITLVIKEG